MSSIETHWEIFEFGEVVSYYAPVCCIEGKENFDRNIIVEVNKGQYRAAVMDAAVNMVLPNAEEVNRNSLDSLTSLLSQRSISDAINTWAVTNHNDQASYKHLNPLIAFAGIEIDADNKELFIYRAADCDVFVQYDDHWVSLYGDWLTEEGRNRYETARAAHIAEHGANNASTKWWNTQTEILDDLSLMWMPTLGLEDSFIQVPVRLELTSNIRRIILTSDGALLTADLLNSSNFEQHMLETLHDGEHAHGDISVLDIRLNMPPLHTVR